MGGAGFVSGIVAHPGKANLIYARTDVGGIYRLAPDTGSWQPLLDWLPPTNGSAMGVESLALDPRDPRKIHLLCGTPYWRGGTSILSSSDYGKTWRVTDVSKIIRAHGNKWGRHTGERLAVDPNQGDILYCGSRESGPVEKRGLRNNLVTGRIVSGCRCHTQWERHLLCGLRSRVRNPGISHLHAFRRSLPCAR